VQHALVFFKPDALALGATPTGVRILMDRLQEKGVAARILAPTLFFPNEQFVNSFYRDHVGQDWFPDYVLKYMLAAHESANFPQAPLLAVVVEGFVPKGEQLTDILRQPDVIGPTYPEEAVAKGDHQVSDVEPSVRYQLVVGAGGSYTEPAGLKDRFNRAHCSDGSVAAMREIAVVFDEHDLNGYVGKKLAQRLTSDAETPEMDKFPLLDIIFKRNQGLDEAAKLITAMYTRAYSPRDFTSDDAELLLRDWARLWPEIMQWNDNYAQASGLAEHQWPFDSRQTSIPQSHQPYMLVSILGPSGVGKSTVVKRLMKISRTLPKSRFSDFGDRQDQIWEALIAAGYIVVNENDGEKGIMQKKFKAVERNFELGIPLNDAEKSHIFNILQEIYKNRFEVITVYTDREDAGGLGEKRITKEQFDAWLHQGRFAAIESAYGVRYGVTHTSLRRARELGGASLMVTGPEIAKALEGEVRTIYLRPYSWDTCWARLIRREAESGRDAEERIKGAKAVYEFLNSLRGGYDTEVITSSDHTIEYTAGKVLDSIRSFANAPFRSLDIQVDQAHRVTDGHRAQRVRELLSSLIQKILSVSDVDASSFDKILASIHGEIIDAIKLLYKEASRIAIGRHPMTAEEISALLNFTAEHISDVISAAIQSGNLPAQFTIRSGGFGALSLPGRRRREKSNLQSIRGLAESIPGEERILLAVAHDLGKMRTIEELYRHDLSSADLLRDARLLRHIDVGDSDAVREIIRIAIKYHHAIGGFFEGGTSTMIFEEMFRDREVLNVISNADGKVDKDKVKALFDRILFLTLIDVGGHGLLSNLRVENYFELRKLISDIVDRYNNPAQIVQVFRSLHHKYTPRRLAAIAAPIDVRNKREYMDRRAGGLRAYAQHVVSPSLHEAVAGGHFSNQELTDFMAIFHRLKFHYFALCNLARDERNTESNPNIRMNPNALKYTVILTNLLKDLSGGRQDTKLEVILADKNNNTVLGRENIAAAMQKMHEVLSVSTSRFQSFDGRILLTDQAGQALIGMEAVLSDNGDGTFTVRIKLNDFENQTI
jgi:guanylate kinase